MKTKTGEQLLWDVGGAWDEYLCGFTCTMYCSLAGDAVAERHDNLIMITCSNGFNPYLCVEFSDLIYCFIKGVNDLKIVLASSST